MKSLLVITCVVLLLPMVSSARTGTPLIYLTSGTQAKLQAKVSANDPAWTSLLSQADTYASQAVHAYDTAWHTGEIMYTYQGGGWQDAAEPLLLAWKVTGDTKYADKLIQLLDVMIAAPIAVISADSYYPTRHVPYIAALIYDWLYDYPALNQNGRKTAIIAKMSTWFAAYKASAYEKNGPALSNYFGGHVLGFGLAGIAMDDDITEPNDKMLTYMKGLWDATVGIDFAPGGQLSSGWPNQGFNYGPSHYSRLLKFAQAYKSFTEVTTGTGVDLFGDSAVGMALTHIYNLMPNRWQASDEGDWPTTYRGIMSAELPGILSGVLSGTIGDQMAFFVDNFATSPAGTGYGANVFTNALFKDNLRTKTDYRTVQPLIYHSVPDQHVYVRSNWTDNAVWSSYNGGSWNWSDHQIKAAGHVALARGADYLLVNASQWKGADGISGSPNTDRQMGDGTNTLFWSDGGVYNYTDANYLGGQGVWGINTNLKYEAGAGYTYSKNDHTSAYDISTGAQNATNRTLRYFHRNYVNLGGTTIVLYDRIQAKSATYTKELRFHLHKQSTNTNSSGVIQSTVGNSRVFIKPISPSGTLTLDTSDITSALPRVRIIPPTSVTDWNPLTVIAAGSNTATMATTTGIDTTAMSGVVIAETTPKVVMFSKDGTQQNAVTYTIAYTGTGNHLLVDITPGAYDIYRDGSVISSATASSQGVLTFSATAGSGEFAIVQTGSTPEPINGTCGTCGTSNGQSLSTAPTTNLCTTGTASSVSGTGPWSWTCAGSDGGTTASCSASVATGGGYKWTSTGLVSCAGCQ